MKKILLFIAIPTFSILLGLVSFLVAKKYSPRMAEVFQAAPYPSPSVEVCNDGRDNDGDALVDCADIECCNASNCQGTPGCGICGNGALCNGTKKYVCEAINPDVYVTGVVTGSPNGTYNGPCWTSMECSGRASCSGSCSGRGSCTISNIDCQCRGLSFSCSRRK